MKVHLDDESPVPLEMMFRYLSQVPNTYVFGMLDICRKEDPEAATQANTYGATDLKEDANSSSNLILLFPRVDLTKREGETNLTTQMEEAINNAK